MITWEIQKDLQKFAIHWSDETNEHILKITKSGNYWYKITDTTGCSLQSPVMKVCVDTLSSLSLFSPEMTVCEHSILDIATAPLNAKYQWNNGKTDSSIIISKEGMYSVTITDTYGCNASDSTLITIQGRAPAITFETSGECTNHSILLVDSTLLADNSQKTSLWIIDKDTLMGAKQSVVFNKEGTYRIKHLVTVENCSSYLVKSIHVKPAPRASFAPLAMCLNTSTRFFNTSEIPSSLPYTSQWYAHETLVSTHDTTSLTSRDSSCKVTLIITLSNGCKDTVVTKLRVTPSPQAIIDHSPSCQDSAFYIFDKSIVPRSSPLVRRSWKIDGINKGEHDIIYHKNSGNQSILVSLELHTVNGCIDTTSAVISPGRFPVTKYSSSLACSGNPVEFNDMSSVERGTIVKRHWKIGGHETFMSNPRYTFDTPGTYPLILSVVSDKGCEDTLFGNISVHAMPVSSFSFTPSTGGVPLEVTFTNTSKHANSYEWIFGSNNRSVETNPTRSFLDEGNHVIHLVARNEHGCVDSSSKQIFLKAEVHGFKILQVALAKNGEFSTIAVTFANLGTNPITSIDFSLVKNDGMELVERWKGSVEPGEKGEFNFSGKYKNQAHNSFDYVCVSASVLNPKDSIVTRDTKCLSNTPDFEMFSLYPIPAIKKATCLFSIPERGLVSITLYDSKGKLVSSSEGQYPAGVNSIILYTNGLTTGLYIMKLSYGDIQKTARVLVSNAKE
jgi:PKD repeat protein